MFKGLGGPGAGQIDGAMVSNMLRMNRGTGFGLGVYGYPLAYGIMPWGQQAQMLNNQWPNPLVGQVGENGSGHEMPSLPSWFTFR